MWQSCNVIIFISRILYYCVQEKASVDQALELLKSDMGKVEGSFRQMKQELNARMGELDILRADKEALQVHFSRSVFYIASVLSHDKTNGVF